MPGADRGISSAPHSNEEETVKRGGERHLPPLVIAQTYSSKNLHSVLRPKGTHLK